MVDLYSFAWKLFIIVLVYVQNTESDNSENKIENTVLHIDKNKSGLKKKLSRYSVHM